MSSASISSCLLAVLSLLLCPPAFSAAWHVGNQTEYADAVKQAQPGDTIIMANGVWKDFEIVFEGKGTKEKPITLKAKEKGKVILSGQSNLRLAGEYLIVEGLVFKNGFTPTRAVISFRKSKGKLANHSRVTETVIDNYNNPERFETDYWVALYGKHNRFDHNHLEGKRNKGVTFAVRLDTEDSRENHHRIDHNYFGPRPILGSNGGETLRIGTSHYSLSNSYTIVENNYFDRCDGELEIISNKSGGNIFRGNVFFESRGTLTMRHGNGNLVENNLFIGNGVDHTGGIRVINKQQTIRNNYMQGLAGYRFGGALVVMNGVPDSPINRYHQVTDALIENNTLINVDHIQLAAGSDTERSAIPINSVFQNNLVYNQNNADIFTVYDDISGIKFANNALNQVRQPTIKTGFTNKKIVLKQAENGLLYPVDDALHGIGVGRGFTVIEKHQTGVDWYEKPESLVQMGTGKTIKIKPGLDTLTVAVQGADSGDTLQLAAGEYSVSRILKIDKPLIITAAQFSPEHGVQDIAVKIDYERSTLFEIVDGGSLHLRGLKISGENAPDGAGNSVIRTQGRAMLSNYRLFIEHCVIEALDINHSFNFINVTKGSFADNIDIADSQFQNISGAILKLDKESDDYGIYNAEYVSIKNSVFTSIQGALIDFYRGGTDESTFGPHFLMRNSVLDKVGTGKRNKSRSSVHLHGVQVTSIAQNKFINSPAIRILHTVGEPRTKITGNRFIATALPSVEELNSDEKNTAYISDNSLKATAP